MIDIVCFQNVTKKYGDQEALKGLSFTVQKGELLALLGPNGAGKSTSLNLLLGLRSPTSGKVEVFGDSPKSQKIRARLGTTPQDLAFPETVSVRELLHFAQGHFLQKRNLDEIIGLLSLQPILGRRALGLSGGEKRKIGLAMALVGDPELLILDEPTTGMDVEARRELWHIIEILVQEKRTIVLTTHYLEEVEALAHRVIVVDQGRALFDGSVQEIKSRVEVKKVKLMSQELQRIQALATVLNFQSRGAEVTILTKDSDQLIRDLVTQQISFKNLSVELASLEEAFLQIRGKT